MKWFNKIIFWLSIVSSINLWINYNITNTQINSKSTVEGILAKIYNPINPDGIETDDWYIYIVENDKVGNSYNKIESSNC